METFYPFSLDERREGKEKKLFVDEKLRNLVPL